VQCALMGGVVYVLEVNPRASRTVPFVSKATGVPWAKIAAKVMAGKTLKELGVKEIRNHDRVAVKSPVFPFIKFPNVQTFLGPEMRSTGEVMGLDATFGGAFAKAMNAASQPFSKEGKAFISVNDNDKEKVTAIARQLHELGYGIVATKGTRKALRRAGIPCETVNKVEQGRPNAVDMIINGDIQMIVNTPLGKISRYDEYIIGRTAMAYNIPCLTTLSAAWAAVGAIRAIQTKTLDVVALQDL
jgi:carbamoyl-phosphate synthase large subunit